jgi:hypothetical protein
MANLNYRIRMGLVEQLEAIRDAIPRLNNAATVVPSDFSGTFIERRNDGQVVEYDMNPVMLILPERVDDTEAEMHIVLEGRITIDKTHFSEHKQLRTISFGTQVGYFRLKKNDGILQHVFGAHYDLTENETGHPAFHAQLKHKLEFADVIQKKYTGQTLDTKNFMENLLKTARLPSAQMDVFAFLLQAVADHLMSPSLSTDDDKKVFNGLLGKNKEIQGRGYSIQRLQEPSATICYRSVHWYPAV